MPRHRQRKTLPYTPTQMFDLVCDIESYPQFLPWCVGARITSRDDDVFTADLVIGFKMFRERFRSKVVTKKPGQIQVDYIRGPLKYLHNEWKFCPNEQGGTTVDFSVDFEFKNRVFEKVVGSLFSEAVRRMVGAFETRADELYGQMEKKPSKAPRKSGSAVQTS
ncbi:MAG: type II toxin-antitoxin system RatA family toxin [Pseudomonadota bacterium]